MTIPMPMPGQPVSAPPGGAPAPAGPLAAITQGASPSMGGGNSAMQLMIFMAGMGAEKFGKFMTELRGGGAHKSTGQKEAMGNPAQTQISPQMLQQLAMRRMQAMQPNAVPGAMGGGMQGNPLAQLMGR